MSAEPLEAVLMLSVERRFRAVRLRLWSVMICKKVKTVWIKKLKQWAVVRTS